MAWADHLTENPLECLYVVRISGLPYLFSHGEIPPGWDEGSGTLTYDSEVYTWSNTMLLGEGMASVTQRLQPKSGLGESGGITMQFVSAGLDTVPDGDLWLHLLCNSLNRTDGYYWTSVEEDIAANVSSGTAAITVKQNKWNPNDFTGYIGLETIVFNDSQADATTVGGIDKRGAYGSPVLTHRAEAEGYGESSAGGCILSDYPLAMEGRFVEMWCVPGSTRSGVFYPYGANLDADDSQIVFAGYVDTVKLGGDLTTVSMEVSSLDRALNAPVCTKFPTGKAGLDPHGAPHIYVGPHNWYLHWRIAYNRRRIVGLDIFDNSAISLGDTITIGDVSAGTDRTYTVVASHTPGSQDFEIGADAEETAFNIRDAIAGDPLGSGAAHYPSWVTNKPSGGGVVSLYEKGSMLLVEDIRIDTDPAEFKFSSSGAGWRWTRPDMATNRLDTHTNVRLRRGDGAGGIEDVPEGVYPVSQVGSYIGVTMAEQGVNFITMTGMWTAEPDVIGGPDGLKIIVYTKNYDGLEFEILLRNGAAGSILEDMGFTEDLKSEQIQDTPEKSGTGHYGLEYFFKPQRGVAAFRWPARGFTAPSRLYMHDMDAWSIAKWGASGWLDDDGASVPRYAVIEGAEVVELSGSLGGVPQSVGGTATRYTLVAERGAFGTYPEKEIYIEYGTDETTEIYRAPAFPGVNVDRMFLYLLLGGSGFATTNHATYDPVSWPGCGANLPSRFVDVESFEAAAREAPSNRTSWVITKDLKLSDVLNEELKITQQQVVCGLGQLYCIYNSPPNESQLQTAHTVDATTIYTNFESKGVGFDKSESRLVNSVELKAGFNPASKRFTIEVNSKRLDSITTWGEKQPVQIEVRGLAGGQSGSAAGIAASVATQIFGSYARPYAVIDLDIATPEAWSWRIGDAVSLTHAGIPSPRSAGRGVTAMACRIVAKEDVFTAHDGTFAKITLYGRAYDGMRYSSWCPSLRATWTGALWLPTAHAFSETDEPLDWTHFAAGDGVYVYRVGQPSTSPVATSIDTISASEVTFDDAIGHTDPIMICATDYDDAATTPAQATFVFWVDDDEEFTNGDRPFYFM